MNGSRRLTAIGKSAGFWFAIVLFAVVFLCGKRSGFVPRVMEDTFSYERLMDLPFPEVFGQIRTIGYPLFLLGLRSIQKDYRPLVPCAQLGIALLALVVFWMSLRKAKLPSWQAFAACACMALSLWRQNPSGSYEWVSTDCLARSVAIFSVSFFLAYLTELRARYLWLTALAAMATYQIRPAFQFIIVLLPLVAGIHLWYRRREPAVKRAFAALCAVLLGPYLAFVLFRGLVFGHYGLVSFDGFVLIASANALMDEALVEQAVPEDLKPFGREILAERRRRGVRPTLLEGERIDLSAYEETAAEGVFAISGPIWKRHCEGRPGGACTDLAANRDFLRFSQAILKAAPLRYGRFIWAGLLRVVNRILLTNWFLKAWLGLMLMSFALRFGAQATDRPAFFSDSFLRSFGWLGWLHTVASLSGIVLLYGEPRYLDSALMWMPALCGMAAYQFILSWTSDRRLRSWFPWSSRPSSA